MRTLVIGNDDGRVPVAPLTAAAVPDRRALVSVSSLTRPTLAQVVDPLPPLEFPHANVSGDEAVLRRLRGLPTLRHLELVDCRDVDVFDHLTAPLRVLDLSGTGRAFPVARLAAVPTLEAVRLNGVRAPLDCAVFRELPELAQLIVLNTERITNVEALLDRAALTSITFVDCADPFPKDGRALFAARGYPHLDIGYS